MPRASLIPLMVVLSLGAACHPIWDEPTEPMTVRNVSDGDQVLGVRLGPADPECSARSQEPLPEDFGPALVDSLDSGYASALPFGAEGDAGSEPRLCGTSLVTVAWRDDLATGGAQVTFRIAWDLSAMDLEPKPLGPPGGGMIYLERFADTIRPNPGAGVAVFPIEE